MWWFVIACCLSVVFCFDTKSAESAIPVESNLASNKELMMQILSNKSAFKRRGNGLDAFCIKDILECKLTHKYKGRHEAKYHFDVIILGGLGGEDSIGNCRDPHVFIRKMKVSILYTVPNENALPPTSSFFLDDVRIADDEVYAMLAWLKREPHHVNKLHQEVKQMTDKAAPTKDDVHFLARHFPNAPWFQQSKKETKANWKVNDARLREIVPLSQMISLRNRNDPLRRVRKFQGRAIAK